MTNLEWMKIEGSGLRKKSTEEMRVEKKQRNCHHKFEVDGYDGTQYCPKCGLGGGMPKWME